MNRKLMAQVASRALDWLEEHDEFNEMLQNAVVEAGLCSDDWLEIDASFEKAMEMIEATKAMVGLLLYGVSEAVVVDPDDYFIGVLETVIDHATDMLADQPLECMADDCEQPTITGKYGRGLFCPEHLALEWWFFAAHVAKATRPPFEALSRCRICGFDFTVPAASIQRAYVDDEVNHVLCPVQVADRIDICSNCA